MILDTENTLYVCCDSENGSVTLLLPKRLAAWMKANGMRLADLDLADPDPDSTDAAKFKLLSEEMESETYHI